MTYCLIDTAELSASGTPSATLNAGTQVGASWHWDGSTLSIKNRGYGFYPLFVLRAPGLFGVGTHITELLEHLRRPELDDAAIAIFLRLGYYVGDDTPYSAVRAMPAVAWLRWSRFGEELGPKYEKVQPTSLSRDDIKAEYRRLFSRAISRSQPELPSTVPLSGGRDSRHILLELNAQRRPATLAVSCLPLPPRNLDDARIAAELAARGGIEHLLLKPPTNQLKSELRKNEITSFCSDEHTWSLPIMDEIAGKSIFDGIAGDVLSESRLLDVETDELLKAGNVSGAAERILSPRRDRGVKRVLSRAAYRRFHPALALERVKRELELVCDHHNPLTQFILWNRTRRSIALFTFTMLAARNQVFSPFLDEDLMQFLLSIPVAQTATKRLHTEVIKESYPEFADIAFEDKGAKTSNRPNAIRYAASLLGFAATQSSVHSWRGLLLEAGKIIKDGSPVSTPSDLVCLAQVVARAA